MECVAFNQDLSQFIHGGENGFEVWTSDPLQRIALYHVLGGVQLVQQHLRSNLFAVVGSGRNHEWPVDKVILWDGPGGLARGVLSFPSAVRAVRLTGDFVVVALDTIIWTCNWRGDRVNSVATAPNAHGILVVSHRLNIPLYAAPDVAPGKVMLVDVASGQHLCRFTAHQTALSAVALSEDCKVIATTSERGTLVRIWDANTGTRLNELRRGSTPCAVRSMAFSACGRLLAMVSSHGTVHLFGVASGLPADTDPGKADAVATTTNRTSYGASFAGWLPSYFSSQWSSSWFYLPAPCGGEHVAVGFFVGSERRPWLLAVVPGRAAFRLGFDVRQGGQMLELGRLDLPAVAPPAAAAPRAPEAPSCAMEPCEDQDDAPS